MLKKLLIAVLIALFPLPALAQSTAGTYPITVTGAQTLDGQAVYIMAFNHQATAFQCDSTESNWVVK